MTPRKATRPLNLDPRHWMPLAEALQRARPALGSIELAERDLHDKLVHVPPRLQAAYRVIVYTAEHPHGSVISGRIERAQWEHYKFVGRSHDGTIWLRCIGERDLEGLGRRGVQIFIRRAEFDRFYPLPAAAVPAAAPAPDDKPRRRTPGPQPALGWRTALARELIRRALAGEPMPTAEKLCELIQDKSGKPDRRTVQKEMKKLLP